MADLYDTSASINTRKLLGDGASGVGPYTSFGNPKLQALKIVSATVDFSTTPTIENSNLYKAVNALQNRAEIYYVGKPGNTATGFVALVNINKTDSGTGYGTGSVVPSDGTYENIEDEIGAALGAAENDVTITDITLTGLTFA